MPKISIVVPVYNVEPYLDKCVQSIINQTYSDFELLLIDDGATDNCPAMCDEYANKYSNVTVYHKQNGGLSDARNYGIERANGEYITFIDSDDYVDADYLEYLYSLFEKAENCKVVCCNHYVVRHDNAASEYDFEGVVILDRKQAFEHVLYHDKVDVSAWAKLYHRSVFENLRYPKGRLYEDTYIFGKVLEQTDNIVLGSEPKLYYVQREKSIVNSAFNEKKLEFIDSANELVKAALECDKGLERGCIRRMSHARMSVLRYMDGCDKKYIPLRKKLRKEILETAKLVTSDPRTPKRDRLAIMTLKFGTGAFFLAWKLYGKIR